jgi:hypothetical protein
MNNFKVEIQSSNNTLSPISNKIAKRAKSSYIHFSNDKEVRGEIKKQNPEWTVTQVAIHLGVLWKQKNDKEKQKWVDMYLKERQDLLDNPIYVEKKVRKGKVSAKSLGDRIDVLEKVVNSLQNDVISLKHKVMN